MNLECFVFPYLQVSAIILVEVRVLHCFFDGHMNIKHCVHVIQCSGNETVGVAGCFTRT